MRNNEIFENEVFKEVSVCKTYSVSNFGRVKNNKKNTILSPRDLRGYKRVSLWYNGKANDHRIHRLVAEAFIPNIENKPEVNHKNGIRNDNRVVNLEWVTGNENAKHRAKVLNQGDTYKGSKNGNSVLSEEDIIEIRKSKKTKLELSEEYKVTFTNISRIINRKLWTHI